MNQGEKTGARVDFPQLFLLNAPLLGGPAGHAVATPNATPVRNAHINPCADAHNQPRGTGVKPAALKG